MGEKTAKELGAKHGITEWSPNNYEKFFVKGYLEEMGGEPEIVESTDSKVVYRLHNCIFFEMSTKMPEIICDVLHESFHEGLIRIMGKEIKISRLTCMAEGDLYCEHACEWTK